MKDQPGFVGGLVILLAVFALAAIAASAMTCRNPGKEYVDNVCR